MSGDEKERQEAATGRDKSRPVATSDDSDYSLSIEDALARYEEAGVPRTPRSIQRYCAKGDLDCHRVETPFGVKFLITPESISRHIAYINEVRLVATSRDMPRQVATDVAAKDNGDEPQQEAPTTNDKERQAATTTDMSRLVAPDHDPLSRYVSRLEDENEFLRQQVAVKDDQIGALLERDRETNLLINGLQRFLGPLLGAPDRTRHEYPTRDDRLSDGDRA
jgi:hypothetical protein